MLGGKDIEENDSLQLRQWLMIPDDDEEAMPKPYCSSLRFLYFPPLEKYDKMCHELYCDDRVMLPFVPQLYKMELSAFLERRRKQRETALKTTFFVDIVEKSTGKFVGVTGFRELVFERFKKEQADRHTGYQDHEDPTLDLARTAEFGVLISSQYQRKGICTEAFLEMIRFGKEQLNCSAVKGVTLPKNVPMCNFFTKYGLIFIEKLYLDEVPNDDGKEQSEWMVFKGDIDHILSTYSK
jgi:RimJ/RimL family protein N-acetyltransferase